MREACELASATGADLLALHVIHDPGSMPGYYTKALLKKPLLGRIEDSAAAMLEEFLDRMGKADAKNGNCRKIESILVRGLPATRIVEVAQQREVKMIIMGSRGHSGMKRLMVGSVAEHVVRLSPIPVTVVKN